MKAYRNLEEDLLYVFITDKWWHVQERALYWSIAPDVSNCYELTAFELAMTDLPTTFISDRKYASFDSSIHSMNALFQQAYRKAIQQEIAQPGQLLKKMSKP